MSLTFPIIVFLTLFLCTGAAAQKSDVQQQLAELTRKLEEAAAQGDLQAIERLSTELMSLQNELMEGFSKTIPDRHSMTILDQPCYSQSKLGVGPFPDYVLPNCMPISVKISHHAIYERRNRCGEVGEKFVLDYAQNGWGELKFLDRYEAFYLNVWSPWQQSEPEIRRASGFWHEWADYQACDFSNPVNSNSAKAGSHARYSLSIHSRPVTDKLYNAVPGHRDGDFPPGSNIIFQPPLIEFAQYGHSPWLMDGITSTSKGVDFNLTKSMLTQAILGRRLHRELHWVNEFKDNNSVAQVTNQMSLDILFGPVLKSVSWEKIDSPLDRNPNVGGGKRIFPGRLNPGDTVHRTRVRVKAKVESIFPNTTVFFRVFDVDDPSSNVAPVDANGAAGNDNRGNPRSGRLSSSFSTANEKGEATTEFLVTMHPGDNFRVAASCERDYLNAVTVNGTNLRDNERNTLPTQQGKVTEMLTVWRRFHIERDVMGPVQGNVTMGMVTNAVVRNNRTILTVGQLTVNNVATASLADRGRNGRFENGQITLFTGPIGGQEYAVATNDSHTVTLQSPIGQVVNGTLFWLVDDDNYDNDLFLGDEGAGLIVPSFVYSLMQDDDDPTKNVFAPAYIRPIYDEAHVQPNSDRDGGPPNSIRFALNVTDAETDNQISLGRDSGRHDRDDYWVVYIQCAYQSDETNDRDPRNEHGFITGATPVNRGDTRDDARNAATVPRGGEGSLIFLENLKEDNAIERAPTASHEVGHQFGLHGHARGFGIMSSRMVGEVRAFVPGHLNVLRWRVRSPGQ